MLRFPSLASLPDHTLRTDLARLVADDCATTARMLAYLAEFEERRLYLPAAYPSMHEFCVGELHFSEDVAFKRLRAARAAREVPAILEAIADGRVGLTPVVLLAPRVDPWTSK